MTDRRALRLFLLAASAVLTLGLVGCAPTAPAAPGDAVDSGDDSVTVDEDPGSFAGAVLPGTGTYAVPDDAPIGGYELPNDQDGQPEGCTWRILDADGTVMFENQGSFVFLTDVTPTFETSGCPDWVQFE